MVFSAKDKYVLRELAKRYREIAEDPVMEKRKILWRDLHDLKPQRPMILFETFSLLSYLSDYEFRCEDPIARATETRMIYTIRQFDQLDDDIVVEPYFRLGWKGLNFNSTGTDFGDIKIVEDKAQSGGFAFKSRFPVATPEDIDRMTPRTFKADKDRVFGAQAALTDAFGDILPVFVGNYDNFFNSDLGNQPFTGNFFVGITWDVFKLIGAEKMMLWPYDEPDALRKLLRFLIDDKKRFFSYLQDEGLICSNTDNQFAGPSSYGYVSCLPANKKPGDVTLKDVWGWADSQETQMFSPAMFDEWYLPAIAEVGNMFGLLYYGCCERVDQKLQVILKALPMIRCISISGWTDVESAFEQMGSNYVASKKPFPAYVSTPNADWDAVIKDAELTAQAMKKNNTPVEVIYRDAYSEVVTVERVRKWIQIYKEKLEIA
jgi:hypothetical protein